MEDYVLMHPAIVHRKTLNNRWVLPMPIGDWRSDLVFVMDNFFRTKTLTVHTQLLVPYRFQHPEQPTTRQLMEQVEYLDKLMQVIEVAHDVRL